MSFNIILQNNKSDKEHITKDVDDVITLTGALRDGCDIRNPIILITGDISTLNTVNYFTIPIWNRSYFLTTAPRAVRTGVFEISGHCDVLSSFATGIKAQKVIIKRAESNKAYNMYLNDGSLKCYQDPYILTEPFPSGFIGASFILSVAGSAGST